MTRECAANAMPILSGLAAGRALEEVKRDAAALMRCIHVVATTPAADQLTVPFHQHWSAIIAEVATTPAHRERLGFALQDLFQVILGLACRHGHHAPEEKATLRTLFVRLETDIREEKAEAWLRRQLEGLDDGRP